MAARAGMSCAFLFSSSTFHHTLAISLVDIMQLINIWPILTLLQLQATAMRLFVVSYGVANRAGILFTVDLKERGGGFYLFKVANQTNTLTPSPGWLTLDRRNDILYLIDEGIGKPKGTLVTYELPERKISTGESLFQPPKEVHRLDINAGGVAATPFGNHSRLAVPQYSEGTLQIFNITTRETPKLVSTLFLQGGYPKGPIKGRQETSHPHHAVLDPSGKYLLVPDLGLDLVHVYSVDKSSHALERRAPIPAPPGSGPRHGVFWRSNAGHMMFYLVGELDATVIAYEVKYSMEDGQLRLNLTQSAVVDTIDKELKLPLNSDGSTRVAPAEIVVSVSSSPFKFHRHIPFRS